MTPLQETRVAECDRTDTEALIRLLALTFNDLDPRLRKYNLEAAFITAVTAELDTQAFVKTAFRAFREALDEQFAFDLDPDGWLDRNDHTSHFTAKDIVDSEVELTLKWLLAL